MKFLCQLFQKLEPEQTDRQTDRQTHTHTHDENITSTAYAGGNNILSYTYAKSSDSIG